MWDELRRWLLGEDPPVRAVSVTLRSGQSVRGALVARHRDALVLARASVESGAEQGQVQYTPMDGEVVVPIENVEYWQRALDASVLETRLDLEGRG